jgi:hypothetical protein
MTKNYKAARCGDTQVAQQTIAKFHLTQKLSALKECCFRWAAWLGQVGGGLW